MTVRQTSGVVSGAEHLSARSGTGRWISPLTIRAMYRVLAGTTFLNHRLGVVRFRNPPAASRFRGAGRDELNGLGRWTRAKAIPYW